MDVMLETECISLALLEGAPRVKAMENGTDLFAVHAADPWL